MELFLIELNYLLVNMNFEIIFHSEIILFQINVEASAPSQAIHRTVGPSPDDGQQPAGKIGEKLRRRGQSQISSEQKPTYAFQYTVCLTEIREKLAERVHEYNHLEWGKKNAT